MKIILEAEVMRRVEEMETPSMCMPGLACVRLRVTLGSQDFQQQTTLRLDEVQSVFDLLMRNLARNMRETLLSYIEDRSYLERLPLMPVLKFERMRG